jgi:hypothetical protein
MYRRASATLIGFVGRSMGVPGFGADDFALAWGWPDVTGFVAAATEDWRAACEDDADGGCVSCGVELHPCTPAPKRTSKKEATSGGG